ncbi:MAG: cell division protein FtsI [Deltaproteobacteria bacterium]|nr:MAG: cell division protein FtsI [Deltaproteobacteria bacterium]
MSKPQKKASVRIRLAVVGSVFLLLLSVIMVRAAYLQVLPSPSLADRGRTQTIREVALTGTRGAILTRSMRELAVSTDSASVAVRPSQITDTNVAQTASALSEILGMSRKKIAKKLTSRRRFVWIKRQISPREKAALNALNLDGLICTEDSTRFYPQKELAGQIIGFCGVDQVGLEGLEYHYNKVLKGRTAEMTLVKDARSRCYNRQGERGRDGDSLVLTLDETIQYVTEKALSEAVRKHKAASGMAVVMDPATGAVLALAHYPAFNPNGFRAFTPDIWRNRAVTDPFEPGSTLKVFLASAALESGSCSPRSIFYCENGNYRVGPDVIHDTHPEKWLSLSGIIQHSSNIGAAKISEKIGKRDLYAFLTRFGFGVPSLVGCPAETAGLLPPHERWTPLDRCAIAFGQGISVSAIQLAAATSAIANGGTLMKPYIVRAITDENRQIRDLFSPEPVRRVISEKTAASVRGMMMMAVSEEGTGSNALVEGYPVAGKTGTAQKAGRNGTYARGKYIASFVGFAPVENPSVTVLVVIDEPKDAYYGGVVAAPVFRDIVRETLTYLNVRPTGLNHQLLVDRKGDIRG